MKSARWDTALRRYVGAVKSPEDHFRSSDTIALYVLQEPDGGTMKGLAFAYDPDGYWVEIVPRGGLDFGDVKS